MVGTYKLYSNNAENNFKILHDTDDQAIFLFFNYSRLP